MAEDAKKHETEIKETAAAEEIAEVEPVQDADPSVADPELKTESEASFEAAEIPAADTAEPTAKTTKAGKHSAKAQREAEAEEARQEAKEHRAEHEDDQPKAPKRQLPNPLHQHGKKYREAAKLVEAGRAYNLDEALDLAQKTATTKFDASVELHINLGVDPRQADQMVRASVVLPHGTGKKVRVAVYADGKPAEDAKAAGADKVGFADLLADIEKGKLDFDLLIATPQGMATLGRVAKILGPRGLMPNPKSGTVTPNVEQAVKEAKAGKVEFRIDKQAIVHQTIGKASFKPEQLRDNANAILSAILKAKPSSAKGTYVKAINMATSMGPGIKLDAPATISAVSTSKK
jgi:large subunit ribosomal protein L1